jgi:hypothetical protein
MLRPLGREKDRVVPWFSALLLPLMIAASCVPVTLPSGFSVGGSVSQVEQNVLSLVNGSEAYSFDLHLESIALSHLAFRSGGSPGANETADWVASQFESFGLQTKKEEYQFSNWDLKSQPMLIIDDDGNHNTTGDQAKIASFQCAHYSWPTPAGGVFSDLVVLPLPYAAYRSQIGLNPINASAWNAVDTSGKVVLIGMEVRWDPAWEGTYRNKLTAQPPAAVIYTFWYDWMSFVPDSYSSTGGRPLSRYGPYYWNLHVPVGFVSYEDGLWIRNREASADVSAEVVIDAAVGTGPHYNVVGRLSGFVEPDRFVIVSGHYDSVMDAGFCDNGAGISGVVELARVFAEAVGRGLYYPKYTIIFVAFADEELDLVGSLNYVKMHKAEMGSIVAVINLDCIGSQEFYFTETSTSGSVDLDQVVQGAAQSLGIAAAVEAQGGSDQESFRDPASFGSDYYGLWGVNLGISDAVPVKSSVMLISRPLTYSDKWSMGIPGWIHTSYDNSTSTTTLNWVEVDDLEVHIEVAALTVIRVSPSLSVTDLNKDGRVNIQDITMVAVAFGSKPGDADWNAVADLDKNGVVNILDITMVAKDYGKTI